MSFACFPGEGESPTRREGANPRAGALIPAAGLSSRMGRFKALLPVDGRPMVRHIAQKLIAAGFERITVVTGCRREEVEAALRGLQIRFVFNERFATTQMLDSVQMGLRALAEACDLVLLVPVDCPSFRVETVQALAREAGDVVIPEKDGRTGHPILIRAEAFPALMAYRGADGLRGAIRQSGLSVRRMATEDEGIFADIDTEDAYRAWLKTDAAPGGRNDQTV